MATTPSPSMKPCIACRELIPAEATICSHCQSSQKPPHPDRFKQVMTWVGAASACIGLFVTLMGGVHWLSSRSQQRKAEAAATAIAQSQLQRGEYEAAFSTYSEMLKSPHSSAVTEGQLDAGMQWLENFSASQSEDKNAVAARLDQIVSVLDAALPKAQGEKKADILAHIGWAHFLNQKMAERDYNSSPQRSFEDALAIDPANSYAHAMLANWMVQTGGDTKQALAHFHAADASGKALLFVHRLEIGGLLREDNTDFRAYLFRTANTIRKNKEVLNEQLKFNVLSDCCDFYTDSHALQVAALSAVPYEEAWATYLWLDENSPSDPRLKNAYIRANLDEIAGNRQAALDGYQQIKKESADQSFVVQEAVEAAIQRLAKK